MDYHTSDRKNWNGNEIHSIWPWDNREPATYYEELKTKKCQTTDERKYKLQTNGERGKPINLEREALEIKQHIHETPHQKADITCTITNKIGGKEGLKRQYKYQGTNLHPIWTTTTQSGNLIEQTNNEPTVKFWYCWKSVDNVGQETIPTTITLKKTNRQAVEMSD